MRDELREVVVPIEEKCDFKDHIAEHLIYGISQLLHIFNQTLSF